MPIKDPDRRRQYYREWYAKPENRQRTIDAVAQRKRTSYAGVCRNCGGPTVGSSKNKIPEWCGKPGCRSAQRKEAHAQYLAAQAQTLEEAVKKNT